MKDTFANNVYTFTVRNLDRIPGTFRQESEKRAAELYKEHKKVIISLSTGLDSQTILHSFASQGVPYEVAFCYVRGVNEIELSRLNLLKNKYGFDPMIVEFDPDAIKEQVIYESELYKTHRGDILHKLFLEKLPKDGFFTTHSLSPKLFKRNGVLTYFRGLYMSAVTRDRALDLVDRTGGNGNFAGTEAMLYSILTDSVYQASVYSRDYFDNTGFVVDGSIDMTPYNFWSHVTKPLLYASHWKNELNYYEKFDSANEHTYLGERYAYRNNMILIPFNELLESLSPSTDPKETVFTQNYSDLNYRPKHVDMSILHAIIAQLKTNT